MEVQQIASRVYACLQTDRGLGCSNSGLIDHEGGLVIDTFWDLAHTRELIRLYSQVRSRAVRTVVNTHHNGDHCWGNQLFPDAEIIGHRSCVERMELDRPEALQSLRDTPSGGDPAIQFMAARLQDWDFSGIRSTPPTTLIEDRLDLDLGGTEVSLIHVGPAHTESDLLVWLPGSRVVFAGDVVFRFCTPLGWEGTFDRWSAALEFIETLDPEIVVPGHGPISGVEGPREMKAYLAYVRSEARQFFDRGFPEQEAAMKMDLGPYADWTEPERLVFNVARAYREFREEPWNAPLDVLSLFRNMYELHHFRAA